MSALTEYQGLVVGQHVTVGEFNPRKVSWQIVSFQRATESLVYASIVSGLAGRHQLIPASRLCAWAPESKEKK